VCLRRMPIGEDVGNKCHSMDVGWGDMRQMGGRKNRRQYYLGFAINEISEGSGGTPSQDEMKREKQRIGEREVKETTKFQRHRESGDK